MDTHKSNHVPGPTASSSQPGATNLAIYGCGQPNADLSSTNSSTVTSVTSTAGSDEEHASATRRRSPFSSDSSELDQCMPLPSGLVKEVNARNAHASDDSRRPNTTIAATTNISKSKSAKKESHQEEHIGAGTVSPCDNCKTTQQQRTCSFYSEPVSWRQDSGSGKGSEHHSPHNKTDTAHARKETSIAVQRNNATAITGKPTKEERSGRVIRSAAAHARRAHGSSSDRLPLHRILNDPRVYYVVAFAGVAALMVVSGAGIALAAHRRRRRRHRRGLLRGLNTAKDMVTAVLTTWITYSRWFRRLVFK